MTQRTAAQQNLVDSKIDEVLTHAGLPIESPIRSLLDRDAEVVDNGREFYVRVRRSDRDISLSERLEELRNDAMFRHQFPAAKPTIAKRDMNKLSENFAGVANGTVRVE